MLRVLSAVGLVGLGGCVVSEEVATTPTVAVEAAAQASAECRLVDNVCADVIVRDLVGTPQLLRAHFVKRVGERGVISRVDSIPTPYVVSGKPFQLVVHNNGLRGTHYLVVSLSVATVRHPAQVKFSESPFWVRETLERGLTDEISTAILLRERTSWGEAQLSRRTTPAPVEPGFSRLDDRDTPAIPPLNGHGQVEYAGWCGPFELDGLPFNCGLVELCARCMRGTAKGPVVTSD